MMVRQISRKEALELAARGCEVLMMGPTTEEPGGWEDYEPGTLDRLLDGCLFFREVPALEKDLFQEITETPPAEPATESRDGSRQDAAETEQSAKKKAREACEGGHRKTHGPAQCRVEQHKDRAGTGNQRVYRKKISETDEGGERCSSGIKC
jgi:hypothetical protein